MVRSLLEYSCPVWDPYRQGDIDKLNKIQRAAARFVTNQSRSYLLKIVFLRTIQTLVNGYSPDLYLKNQQYNNSNTHSSILRAFKSLVNEAIVKRLIK